MGTDNLRFDEIIDEVFQVFDLEPEDQKIKLNIIFDTMLNNIEHIHLGNLIFYLRTCYSRSPYITNWTKVLNASIEQCKLRKGDLLEFKGLDQIYPHFLL